MPYLVALIMGSKSDWETMSQAATVLEEMGIQYEARVVSAHRTPDLLMDFAGYAEKQGFEVIIAGAGGAAHLPGMTAAKTLLPVIGVPIESQSLRGMDSLLSIVQMPPGIPVATMAIGEAGAKNAALLAVQIIARHDAKLAAAYRTFKSDQAKSIESKNRALQERTGGA